MKTHVCKINNRIGHGYEIRLHVGEVWGIYDKLTHQYVMYISFCPFCGEKL